MHIELKYLQVLTTNWPLWNICQSDLVTDVSRSQTQRLQTKPLLRRALNTCKCTVRQEAHVAHNRISFRSSGVWNEIRGNGIRRWSWTSGDRMPDQKQERNPGNTGSTGSTGFACSNSPCVRSCQEIGTAAVPIRGSCMQPRPPFNRLQRAQPYVILTQAPQDTTSLLLRSKYHHSLPRPVAVEVTICRDEASVDCPHRHPFSLDGGCHSYKPGKPQTVLAYGMECSNALGESRLVFFHKHNRPTRRFMQGFAARTLSEAGALAPSPNPDIASKALASEQLQGISKADACRQGSSHRRKLELVGSSVHET